MSAPILISLALLVGVLIGTVGIGGVVLPPFLTWFGGFDPHLAAGTSSWAFLFTGIVGTVMYTKHTAVPWRLVGLLTLGIVPSAICGALVNGLIAEEYAMAPLAILVTLAGINQLVSLRQSQHQRPARNAEDLRAIPAIAVGATVGFASALTGTGGPVFMVPLLLVLHIPTLAAIATAQVIQLPLVLAAVFGYTQQNAVDFSLGSIIGVFSGIGVAVGALIAVRLPRHILSRVAGFALSGFGLLLLASSAFSIVEYFR